MKYKFGNFLGFATNPAWWTLDDSEVSIPADAAAYSAVAPGSSTPASSNDSTPSGLTGAPVVTATVGDAAPSWISTLTDPTIQAAMAAADVNGTVTEAGMATLFTDLDSELSTGNATLSTSQFNDLKTIAASLNVGETASAYLTYIVDAEIDGSTANAYWTGGGSTTSTLGNLAVGETAAKLNELTGKWFLGTDLPTSVVKMTGDPTFSVTYSTVSLPLYAASEPSINDVNQGYLGDCYLEAVLAEVADRNPLAIESMITDNGNGTYGVRFYVDGVADYVTVNDQLADGGTIFNTATDLWASLIEKAYAQVQALGVITGNSVNYGNSFSTIGNGGVSEDPLEEVTGASQITNFQGDASSWYQVVYNGALAQQSLQTGLSTSTVQSDLVADLNAGYDLVLASNSAASSSGRSTLVASHEFSIYGYDSSTGEFELRNPWGTESGQTWDTTFEVSLATLLAADDTITVDNLSGDGIPPTTTDVTVAAAVALQVNAQVTSFTIADTAANVFAALTTLASDSKLTSITLTDTATPSETLTYAQFNSDAAVLAKIASPLALTATGATVAQAAALQTNGLVTAFTISDTAANVFAALGTLAGDGKLASIAVTNATAASETLTDAQFISDSAVIARIGGKFALAVTGATVAQAAALQSNTQVSGFTVADTAANVFAALTTLAADSKLTAITLTDTTTPSETPNDAQFTSDAPLLAKIGSKFTLTVTGAAVAQAAAAQSNAKVTSFIVADTAADVFAALTTLTADSKLKSITLTDTATPSETLTGTQFNNASTLLAKIASQVSLTVTGATAAQAAAAQAITLVTAFAISDTAANVFAVLGTLAGDGKLESITLTNTTTASERLTYAQFTADTAVLAKIAGKFTLAITGATATQAAALQSDAQVGSLTITDTAANVFAALAALGGDSGLTAITLIDTTTPSESLTYAQFTSDAAVVAKIGSKFTLTVAGATVTQAAALQSNAKVSFFTITDTGANVFAALTTLTADSKLKSITLTDTTTPAETLTYAAYTSAATVLGKIASPFTLTVTGATAAQAAALQASSLVSTFTVFDSAANVFLSLSTLGGDSKLTSITLSNTTTPAESLTYAQFTADTTVLAKVASPFTLTVTGATVAQAATLQANSLVGSFTISDTSANVFAALAALEADSKLTAITLTSSAAQSFTEAQFAADSATLAKIGSTLALTVTGATVAQAAALQLDAQVVSFSLSDTSANVFASLTALAGDSKLKSIALTDATKPAESLTYAAYASGTTALGKIASPFTLTVTGATAAEAAALQSNALVSAFTVSDSSADVVADLSLLNGDSKLSSIALTDTNALSLTYAQFTADTSALGKLPGSYTAAVSQASAAEAAALQANANVASFMVTDTAADVTANNTALAADGKLQSLAITGTTGTDTLNLAGVAASATINLDGDTAKSVLDSPSLTFVGTPDSITLGSGQATISFGMSASGGIETIAGFQFGVDDLDLTMAGTAKTLLQAEDTTVNGVKAIALYSSADPSHGVVLTGVSSSMSAATLLASYVTYNGTGAVIS